MLPSIGITYHGFGRATDPNIRLVKMPMQYMKTPMQ
jgi:hypothetical protein